MKNKLFETAISNVHTNTTEKIQDYTDRLDKLKLSIWRNKITNTGLPYVITEVGVVLFFGGQIQKYYEITHCKDERPYSNETDLFNLEKVSGICPIAFDKIS